MCEVIKDYVALFGPTRKNCHKQLAIAAMSEEGKNEDPWSMYFLIS